MQKILSLIIPTNGITEWVRQVVESIYVQNVDDSLFEVVITDNGESDECKNTIEELYGFHSNLRYKKTNAKLFLNQIEAFKLAEGLFIKFINHRFLMIPESIQILLDFVINHKDEQEKPITFFLNESVDLNEKLYDSFDSFVRALGNLSSWSGGLASWKEDFQRLPKDMSYDPLYPHTSILFYYTKRQNYIINYTNIYHEISTNHLQKGKYNLYYAFGVAYPSILLNLRKAGSIDSSTFMYLKKENEKFLVQNCYLPFNICHNPHSYDLSGAKECLDVFYNYRKIVCQAWSGVPLFVLRKIVQIILKYI